MKTLEFETEIMSTFSTIINGYVVEDEKVYDTITNIYSNYNDINKRRKK